MARIGTRWSTRGSAGLLWAFLLFSLPCGADQNTGGAEQDTSSAAQKPGRFYVGLQTGVLLDQGPVYGFRGGWHPLSGAPGFALEVDYATGWPREIAVGTIGIVLGSRTRRSRGYYFRLGLDLVEIALGMQVPLSDSVFLRPEIRTGVGGAGYYAYIYAGLILRADVYL